jgi:hypothetical protein
VTATLGEGLFHQLTTHPRLAALIGTRLHPDWFLEDEVLPAVAYSLEDERSYHTLVAPRP